MTDLDDRLRDAGRRWREGQGAPSVDPFEAAMSAVGDSADDRDRSRRGRSLVGVVVAAASVAAVATGAFVVADRSGANSTGPQPGGPVASGSPTASSTPSPSPSSPAPSVTPSPSASGPATAAPCQARNLRVSYDPDRSGAAAGSTNVAVALENVGDPCQIAGFPVVSRVDAGGSSTRLDLTPEAYPTYGLIVTGPGLLAHGARAGILLHYSSQDCAVAPGATGRRLRVTTADGSSAETAFPAELGPCAGSHGFQAEAGLLKPLA